MCSDLLMAAPTRFRSGPPQKVPVILQPIILLSLLADRPMLQIISLRLLAAAISTMLLEMTPSFPEASRIRSEQPPKIHILFIRQSAEVQITLRLVSVLIYPVEVH